MKFARRPDLFQSTAEGYYSTGKGPMAPPVAIGSRARTAVTRPRHLLSQLRGTWQVPLYRSSYSLILTTSANAALGIAFWVAAARLYPAGVVGLGAGGVSSLQLVATIGWVGLRYTIMRYVPTAGYQGLRLIALVYAVGAVMALSVALIFTVFLSRRFEVPFVSDGAVSAVAFCAGAVIWVVFSLQDAALVGIRRPLYVPLENAVFGALKLALLFVLAAWVEPWTLLGVWIGAAAFMAMLVNGLLFRGSSSEYTRVSLPPVRTVARFSIGHTAVGLVGWVPDLLVPILVLWYLGDAHNAYYYAAWTIGFSTRLLLTDMVGALTVEAAYADHPFRCLARSAIRLSVAVLTPAVTVLALGADLVLGLFGADYASAAGPLLRYLALSIVPSALVAFVVALDMARERFGVALMLTSAGSTAALCLDVVLIPTFGITGAGLGWLVGQTAAAVLAIVCLLVSWRRPRREAGLPQDPPGQTPSPGRGPCAPAPLPP